MIYIIRLLIMKETRGEVEEREELREHKLFSVVLGPA